MRSTTCFDKDYHFENIRITITGDTEVPSISGMYWNSFIYENEMHDLFGIQVRGMNIDFKGTLYPDCREVPVQPAAGHCYQGGQAMSKTDYRPVRAAAPGPPGADPP